MLTETIRVYLVNSLFVERIATALGIDDVLDIVIDDISDEETLIGLTDEQLGLAFKIPSVSIKPVINQIYNRPGFNIVVWDGILRV